MGQGSGGFGAGRYYGIGAGLLGAAAFCCGVAAEELPFFVDATAVAGISHSYEGGEAFVVGGGVAAFDCNDDGLPELAIAGADAPLGLYLNVGRAGRLPAFERMEAPLEAPLLRTTGAYPLDFDGDGILDLFVLRFGQNVALRGLGECFFEDVTEDLGLPERADWSTAFAATWEEGADLPTLFVGNYVPRDRPLQDRGNCEASYILRGADGVYGAPISTGKGACTLSALFLDWSGNGQVDLRLANDREYYDRGQSEQLLRLTPDGVAAYGKAEGWDDVSLWGMGLAAEDVVGDARPEIVVTSMADNRMEHLRGGDAPAFENIARAEGTTAQRPAVGPDVRPSTAWHTEFGDANNDGWPDLLIIKGNVDEMPRMAGFDPDVLLLGGADGFRDVGYQAGIAVDTKGRGAAFADLNGDGALDILTVNRNQPARLFAGKPMGGFVTVDPRLSGANAFAVGATVEVDLGARVLRKTRRVGGGHAGGALVPLQFGIGTLARVRMRVVWPDGRTHGWQELEAGARVVVDRVD